MDKTIIFYKKIGETPLQCLLRFRKENQKFVNEKISYAGRLDPMAEGEMLFIMGEENKNKEKYLGLDKKYTFKILFGVSTDTGDVLGMVEKVGGTKTKISEGELTLTLKKLVRKHEQKYPWFSSKTVFGKPLFEWFRSGRRDDVERPTREIEIYSMKLLSMDNIWSGDLKKYIQNKIKLIEGDFRQNEILNSWEKFFTKHAATSFQIAEVETKCSGGTYIRSLVERIGKKFNVPALALHIKRDKICL